MSKIEMTGPTEITVDGVLGTVKKLDSTPPSGVDRPVNVLTQEVVVENNPQPLRTIRPYGKASAKVPSVLPSEAQIVLHLLLECFDNKQEVKEGLTGDIIWGFSQGGTPPELTYRGLAQLASLGYVRFQAPDGAYVDLNSTAAEKSWTRYEPKLLEMVYE